MFEASGHADRQHEAAFHESQTTNDPAVSDHSDVAVRVLNPVGLRVQPSGRHMLDVGNNPKL